MKNKRNVLLIAIITVAMLCYSCGNNQKELEEQRITDSLFMDSITNSKTLNFIDTVKVENNKIDTLKKDTLKKK